MQRTLRKKPLSAREGFWGAVFLAPTFIGFLMFTLIPVVMSFVYSFTDYDGITQFHFIGTKNYIKLFGNKEFLRSLSNTLYFTIGKVPVGCLLALIIAVVLNQKIRFRNFYRACYFMPTIVSTVAISVVFQQIFNKDFGLMNGILGVFGIQPQEWLASKTQAMPVVIFITVWKGLGVNVVIFLAGLTGVDPQLYEAASIDGATAVTRFWKITLPMMAAPITFVLINNTIQAFQTFDQIYMLTGGGPAKATQTLSYLIFNNAFEYFKQGYASAMAYVLFVIILVVSVLQLSLSRNSKN